MRSRSTSLLTLALAAALGWSGTAFAAGPAAQIEAKLGPGVVADGGSETSRSLTFLGTDPGASIPIAGPARPAVAAEAALERFADEFGLPPASELDSVEVTRLDHGRSNVSVQQTIDGVPVIGGQLVVSLDRDGDLLSIGGELEPDAGLSTDPGITAAEADDAAYAVVARTYGVDPSELRAAEPVLSVYDSRILGGPGLERPTLVWRTEVTDGTDATAIREVVFVDARTGDVALNFSQIAEAKNRFVCDQNNVADTAADPSFPCVAPYDRTEASAPSAINEVNLAFNFTGGVYDFFFSRFARDSINGAGMPLITTTRYCQAAVEMSACPYNNAFWNGTQMTFGQGFVTDDITGHELTHGVTEAETDLFYYYQSGAINESLSDVFGELFDLASPSASPDTPANRWFFGEDRATGATRNMANPPAFGDPDSMTSPFYSSPGFVTLSSGDAGGVHTNSGVNNKAAFLLTDGGSFNGQTVGALGATKVAHLYYEVEHLLWTASDYGDLANALRQACANLAGSGALGFTGADCTQVNSAVLAVSMDAEPPNAAAPEASTCPVGEIPSLVFADDIESGVANWTTVPIVGTQSWFLPAPASRHYARSGNVSLWGWDRTTLSDSAMEMTTAVTIPPDGNLRFAHAYGFDESGGVAHDGGVLEYSANGAPFQDAGPLLVEHDYDGTLAAGSPLAGRQAFTGESYGYTTSRADLSSLEGQSVRFRFRLASDAANGDYGWWVDDVQIYGCTATVNVACEKAKKKLKKAKKKLKKAKKKGVEKKVKKAKKKVKKAKKKVRKAC